MITLPRFSIRHSVRGRLLLAAVLVEGLMLTLLVSNSIRLVRDYMTEQAQDHAEQIAPVLNAALVAPLAQRDYATVQAVLDESRLQGGIQYLVVTDVSGQRVATSGWGPETVLPKAANEFQLLEDDKVLRFDVMRPIELAGQKLGTLHFGLDLSRILVARRALFNQGALIAGLELLFSAGLLAMLGLWMTRHVTDLRKASEAVAAGNLTPLPVSEGEDEIGRLGAAFNLMSRAVAERVADITAARDEQIHLKEAAKREHSRLIALLSAMDIGVLLLDEFRHVVFSNAAFHRVWAIESRSLVGKSASDVFSLATSRPLTGDPIPFQGGLEESRGGSAPVELELDDKRVLSRRSRVVADPDGRVTGLLWLFEDVTAAKEAERRLFDALKAAEAASEAKVAFLATMSHEIRTPMNGIIGMTDLMAQSDLTAEQREHLNWVKSSADSLLSILNDVLDFAKIDARRLTLESTSFDLADLAKNCVGLYSVIAREKAVKLDLLLEGECPARVIGDPVRLRQVMTNLLSNALKFTPSGGRVSLAIRRLPDPAMGRLLFEFAVADTGLGIPADKIEHIFTPFEQADSSTTRKFGGTGLGLAIVARLVALMDGKIRVDSEVGKGSTFSFEAHFAIAADGDGKGVIATKTVNTPHSAPGNAYRVLLVEDTPVNQILAQTMLRKNGFQVVLARDGVEALEALSQDDYDVVLMDMQMPNMDGLEATRRFRAIEASSCRRTPVIALTANAMDSDRERCFAAGMDDFVSKPFRVDDMLAAIQRQMRPKGP